jgi:hypothetical protein
MYHCWKEPVWKDLTVEINCIPPQLTPLVYGGIHRWYRGIIESLSRWHKWNIWFLHLIFFISLWWYGQFFLISNFKDENFQIISFQIFVAYFNFFHSPLVVWSKFFKFQNRFFSIFFISLWWYDQFFSKFKNKKFQFKFQKRKFFNFFIS